MRERPVSGACAVSEAHARILEQVGVRNVVRPEHDMGQRVAHLARGSLLDHIEFEDGYAIVTTRAPSVEPDDLIIVSGEWHQVEKLSTMG